MEKSRIQRFVLNLALFSGSILLALLISEIFVRVFIPQDKKVTWIEMHPNGFMMNQASGSAIHEFDERVTTYYFTPNRTRGSVLPDPNKKRILTLGDSFTFGLHLNEENTYINRLQQKADSLYPDSVQFLNAAIGGTGLADWPGWLDNFGEAIQPDLVVMFLNTNDIERSLSKNLFVYDEASDSLILSQRWKPNIFFTELGNKRWYRWLQKHSELMNIIVKVLWKFVYFEDVTHSFDQAEATVPIPTEEQLNPESTYSLLLAQKVTQQMDDWCMVNGCRFIMATTGFFDASVPDEYTSRFYSWLTTSDSLSYPFYDITGCVLENTGNDLPSIQIPGDSHPNEQGANVIADCSLNWLESELSNALSKQN